MKLKLKPLVAAAISFGLINTNLLMADEILSGVTLSGSLQIETEYNRDYDDTNTSDIVVDELTLGIEAQVHKWVNTQILFLYEEGETPLEIDEAFITLGDLETLPIYLSMGQLYVPFGNFETHMISDPLTLELAEIREKALQVGFETAGFYGSIYGFNGSTQEDSNDTIDHYGTHLGFAQEHERFSYDIGVGYLNDLGDTFVVSDALEAVDDYDYVGGLGTYLTLNIGPVSLIGEYITALDPFDAAHLAFNGQGAEPKAWNVEAGLTFDLVGYETTLALGYQATEEALALELPETRILAALSLGLDDHTRVSLEYASDEDYDENDGGTGKDAETVTLQLAVEF